jgi:hypothetical protein
MLALSALWPPDLLPPLPFFLFSPFFHPPSRSRPLCRPPTISSSSTVDLDHHYRPLPTFNTSLSLAYTAPSLVARQSGPTPYLNARSYPHHHRTTPSSIHQFHRALTLRRSFLLANCLHIPRPRRLLGPSLLTCHAVSRSQHPHTLDTHLELTTATALKSNHPFPYLSSTQQVFQNAVV